MTPGAGERRVRFVGDCLTFTLAHPRARVWAEAGWIARLRTNLGRAAAIRREVIQSKFQKIPLAGASWRDIPMRWVDGEWQLVLPLTEVGWFKAKPYLLEPHGSQHWPEGDDFGVSVHPNWARTANTLYCAFARMFGDTKSLTSSSSLQHKSQMAALNQLGYTVIPPSGKLRDLARQLPHIFDTLGCRILHLLPVNPTPTTYARFGDFGSPYAAEDLTGIDPSLVEFDKRTTGVEQFQELTSAVHARGGRIFLDIVINHTGWGSWLQENHPEWFLRKADGHFESPGAWGTVWEDLVELVQRDPALWEYIADALLTWCRRGVDGFRCDAGYKVPAPAWQHIIARVREEFPDTVFLLEGLGGGWGDTEALLTEGGMQWAYSELFQEFSPLQVAGYLNHAHQQSVRVGTLVHYSETHDNERLAKKGRAWSLLRNQLSALTSVNGGFGFTCGVEWLCDEKINVHSCRALAWGAEPNLVAEIAQLNALLANHPAFFDGAKLTRLSPSDSPIYALHRESAEGRDAVLVLVNNDPERAHRLTIAISDDVGRHDLLSPVGDALPRREVHGGKVTFLVSPGAAHCLSATAKPVGLCGEAYRRTRAQAAFAHAALAQTQIPEHSVAGDWRALAAQVDADPRAFLARVAANSGCAGTASYAPVVEWSLADTRRVLLIPPGHWLLVRDNLPFRVTLASAVCSRRPEGSSLTDGSWKSASRADSIPTAKGHVACFAPQSFIGEATLSLDRLATSPAIVSGTIRFIPGEPAGHPLPQTDHTSSLALLTNGSGAMARICVDLGTVRSKYDCVLGANLHASVPVDRHVFVKRLRVWVNADGFITPLNAENLVAFKPGPPAHWRFVANAGDGRSVEIHLLADMEPGRNTTRLRFVRPPHAPALGHELPAECSVSLTVRFDLEDRSFHCETKRNAGSEYHFGKHSHSLQGRAGFAFTPEAGRELKVWSDAGRYHHEGEWSMNLSHSNEATRGQEGCGDAFSPGWFELPLHKGRSVTLAASAEADAVLASGTLESAALEVSAPPSFSEQLERAVRAYVVHRANGKTVIAGYPWFLDWGRDTLICARGLLAAGFHDEVRQILVTFGRFAENGTLPNAIHGDDASNRDTSDAPLWFGIVCEDFAAKESAISNHKRTIYSTPVDAAGRTLKDVLQCIAEGYLHGTPNGIRVDTVSGLVWSPSHFTWMDTNYPAGTPREGYPIEIQALWIRLLRQLDRLGCVSKSDKWSELAARAEASIEKLFWLEDEGWFADCLLAKPGVPARQAVRDQALRSNCLFPISLGLVTDERARRTVDAAVRHLVVPGALRSLAPLPVKPPLPIYGAQGQLLNDPANPYWGRYEGDEDTRRKPAYHNGTAWTWTFPSFCEALARAHGHAPEAVAAARAYLGSAAELLNEGCLGHLPEIVDGDAPHAQRGCDAQAWGATEVLRVWRWFESRGQ